MRLLTTRQAADILGVTASRIRQLVLERKLPAEKAGRDLLLKSSDVEAAKSRVTTPGRPKQPAPRA